MEAHKEEVEAFWKSVEKVHDVRPEDCESKIREIKSSYKTLKKALDNVVPSDIRMATDRALQLLQPSEETTVKSTLSSKSSSRRSRRSRRSSTGTVKGQIEAERAALEVEMRAKLDETKRVMEIRQREEEERARRARHDFDLEMMSRELENRRLRSEIAQRDAELKALGLEKKEPAVQTDPNSTSLPNDDDESKEMKAFAKALTDSIAITRMPPPEPPVFTGDPLEYPSWKASFDSLIDGKGLPAFEKIHYLQRYLGGDAKETVAGVFLFDNEDTYQEARKILDDRYGNSFLIGEAFRDKLYDWPRVKDSKDIRKFTDFLRQCCMAMRTIEGLAILNDCRENRKLLQKLPDWLVARWARIVTDHSTYPDFKTFYRFMEKEAEVVCNPITSLDKLRDDRKGSAEKFREDKTKISVDKRKTGTHVHTSEVKMICLHCQGKSHSIHTCRAFKALSPKERRDFIIAKGMCFKCLGTGHISKKCKQGDKIECKSCQGRHQTILCGDYDKLFPRDAKKTHPNQKSEDSDDVAPTVLHTISGKADVFRTTMIVPVILSTDDNEMLTYAMLDTQSDATFINRDIGEALKAPSEDVSLRLTTMSGSSTKEAQRFTRLKIRNPLSKQEFKMPAAYAIEDIPLTKDHIPSAETARGWDHLKHLERKMMPLQDAEVGVLLGVNCPQALAPLNAIRGRDTEPYAIETALGWSIVGGRSECNEVISHRVISKGVPTEVQTSHGPSCVNFVFRSTVREVLPSEFVRAFGSDTFISDEKFVSQDDFKFLKLMENRIHQNEEGYYEMPLPFKQRPDLPHNITSARQRLVGLKKRLCKNSDFHDEYKTFMKTVIDKGEAEEVPPDELDNENVWYIPHHGVYHPQKKKLRVVFDASARFRDTALNDHLMQGPDQFNSLAGLLCRFRTGPVAFTCDVERMFHQFYVAPSDRDYLRLLWWKDRNLDQEVSVYRMKVNLFGATSSPACAIYGMRRIALDHSNEFSKAATEFIADDFYMDDGLKSVELATEAIQIVQEARDLCQRGHLRLHKFISNSPAVINSIPESERAKTVNKDLTPEVSLERTLGLHWCLDSDQFQYKMVPKNSPVTRRAVLSTVASLYDPLRFLAPSVLVGRLILQQMCKHDVGWDDPVPKSLSDEWLSWKADLEKLDMIRINRCYRPQDFGKVVLREVHHFSNASSQGYGYCAYMRLVSADGDVHCSLIMGKSRVAPKKTLTIPRLELCAAVLMVKSAEFLRSQLRMRYEEFLWIIGMSRQVSSIVYKCVACRKLRGMKQDQKMADLPKIRTEDTPPFTYVGMDCFGPFLVKEGRKELKKYGLLFTCMATRAVHIEVLDDMTTDCFLNGLRCLIAIRGPVRTLFSDRGTNFVGASNEMDAALREIDDERIKTFLLEKRCDFEMNTPHSSHMGGTWERQICTVRSTLQGLLQGYGGRLDAATLRTFMYEAMSIVNSRPLGLETLNDPCSLSPITPNQLLTMKSEVVVPPPGNFVAQDAYARKRWRKVQFLDNEFWRRWRNEYLQHLQLRQKWNKEKREMQVGDIVVLKEDD